MKSIIQQCMRSGFKSGLVLLLACFSLLFIGSARHISPKKLKAAYHAVQTSCDSEDASAIDLADLDTDDFDDLIDGAHIKLLWQDDFVFFIAYPSVQLLHKPVAPSSWSLAQAIPESRRPMRV